MEKEEGGRKHLIYGQQAYALIVVQLLMVTRSSFFPVIVFNVWQ
jgi:hypothetical protein